MLAGDFEGLAPVSDGAHIGLSNGDRKAESANSAKSQSIHGGKIYY